MLRAYSFLHVKEVDADKRIITGTATTPTPDRMHDVVEPLGVTFKNPLPLLLYHDSKKPVGWVKFQKPTAEGVKFEAKLPTVEEPGTVRDRVEEAWTSIKTGLLAGVSIGFRALEESFNKETGGYNYLRSEVLELSLVAIPAQPDARIETIKSLDVGLAATGTEPAVPSPPGASGLLRVVKMRHESSMKTIAEQIAGWEASRKSKTDKIDSILAASGEKGETLSAEQTEEHDALAEEVKSIDGTIERLRAAEARQKAAAVPVSGGSTGAAARSREGASRIIRIEDNLPKGCRFARYAICVANSRGIPAEAMRLAQKHYPDDSAVLALVERGAVAGASTSGSNFIDDMIPYNVMNDFIEFLRPGSILGKFGGPIPGGSGNYPSLRRVGFNERVSGMSTGYTAGWKGEGLPALPSAAVTFNDSLTWNCMSALAVLTKEAIRFSNPSAEMRVRDEIAKAVNYKLDYDFVDPAKAASGTTSPASITNAIAATTPSGTAATNVRHDIAALLGDFATNKLDPSDLVIIMSATMAAQISMMMNTLGQPDFPGLTMAGGRLATIPVIVSEHLTSVGSPSTQMIVMVKASEIYLADDGVVTVEASDQASIEMQDSSSQTAIAGTGASLVSMFQTGAVALLANREITWKRRRSTAVQYLSPCAYAVPTS